jgi:hypothetical protein
MYGIIPSGPNLIKCDHNSSNTFFWNCVALRVLPTNEFFYRDTCRKFSCNQVILERILFGEGVALLELSIF